MAEEPSDNILSLETKSDDDSFSDTDEDDENLEIGKTIVIDNGTYGAHSFNEKQDPLPKEALSCTVHTLAPTPTPHPPAPIPKQSTRLSFHKPHENKTSKTPPPSVPFFKKRMRAPT